MKNLKFHAIAITAICLIIIALYSVMGVNESAPQIEPTPQHGDRQITIDSATWGENCNDEIDRALAERANASLPTDTSGNHISPEKITKILANNMLPFIGNACNGKFVCEVFADTKTLGINPMDGCYKNLVVSYRCFDFDRLTTLTIPQGDDLKINCRNDTKSNATAPTSAQ